ncbi:hypothetical protein [Yoonia sp.]|uniref:hypothetical protein n=1 Tax=Yoonia sp. TaxID=2212373 RepID=UPI002E064B44|nr:hypothetical protein [Yoonia sp.]
MIEALLQTILGPLGGTLAGLGAVIAALVLGRWQGAKSERNKRNADEIKAQERGRQAVRDGRASGNTPDERVRNNDGMW